MTWFRSFPNIYWIRAYADDDTTRLSEMALEWFTQNKPLLKRNCMIKLRQLRITPKMRGLNIPETIKSLKTIQGKKLPGAWILGVTL